jgi:putative ATP-dependent endonuclease of OLD family
VAAFCDAGALLIVRNDAGTLRAKPMLARPLGQDAVNAVRRLFQINRVETAAAMMCEIVLVPEGRFDFEWLGLLTRAVELGEAPEETCLFGVRVGVIPTDEAKVKETCRALAEAHPRICTLLDGDAEGARYADELRDPAWGARTVLRWPDGWTIEDVVGWIIEADEATVMARIDGDLAVRAGDRATLIARLKSDDRDRHGMKSDRVAHEIIAGALAERPLCVRRARLVLGALAQACAGTPAPQFETVEEGPVPRLVFRP